MLTRSSATAVIDRLRARVDVIVLAGILAAGVVYFWLSQRGSLFYSGDIVYLDLAHSILHRSYAFNHRFETMLPPGFPAVLALVIAVFGDSHAVMVRTMTLFTMMGLGVSYLLLRRAEGRAFAAIVTALLLVSPTFFRIATTWVFSDLLYLLTSTATLLTLYRLDTTETSRAGSVERVLCAVLMAASVLVRSAGITLVLGLAAWLAVVSWRFPATAGRRWKTFVPVLLAGVIVQAGWMAWVRKTEAPAEWPIGGYPRSYTAQLSVKNGNEPERGLASAADIPSRVGVNLAAHGVGFIEAVTGKGGRLSHSWFTPWVVGPVLLIVVGLWASMWPTGGRPEDWYFIAHESMYLLWPWDLEIRFILGVVPLACLYFWRGIRTVAGWATRSPRVAARAGLLLGVVCGGDAAVDAWRVAGLRSKLAALCWLLFVVSILIARWRRRTPAETSHAVPGIAPDLAFRRAVVALCMVLFVLNIGTLTGIARENVAFDLTQEQPYAQILAAQWIRLHTLRNTVVMARQVEVVHHYSERSVVWFPPISDPHVLYEGIRRNHVSLIVVVDWDLETYWRPAEKDCFERLLKAYPEALTLIQRGPRERIYAVVPEQIDDQEPAERTPEDG
jgi:hypothetical protein